MAGTPSVATEIMFMKGIDFSLQKSLKTLDIDSTLVSVFKVFGNSREDLNTIMSILQMVKSAGDAELTSKFRKAEHVVNRLCIILENQELINKLENL
ncbi:hypothetical protein EVAR_38543_1 [Eumeta japonica]|uniref:Uncharacterized protein n=1 Tax=Eumeta variegata TaxID=151549 RepID=A0A4C1WB00_EUMVA|nr:hypothetical protein EVAR_38543_1 [Eumeta japonica]